MKQPPVVGTAMKDRPQIVRQWQLIQLLCARRYGITIQQMVDETGVSDKTIRRDLKVLQNSGFPVEEQEHERGRKTWRIPNNASTPRLHFTYDEAIALYLGRRFMQPLAGTYFWHSAKEAFRKIRSTLDETGLNYLEQLADKIHFQVVGASDYSEKGEMLDQLTVAIEDRLQTVLLYHSQRATEPVEYAVYPLGLVYHKSSLYLVAHSLEHGEVRHFKLDRIHGVDAGPVRFETLNDFNLADHMADSFGIFTGHGHLDVAIRFLPPVVRYVEEGKFHSSQELTRQPDGSLIARFSLSSLQEIKSWVLSFGRHAIVLSPPELCQAIHEEIQAMAGSYESVQAKPAKAGRKK